uniref:Uncharacterized protein n=1 Tax=Salix viminalis TaxID=40686 RepID=A0A6N2NCA1_SALVM
MDRSADSAWNPGAGKINGPHSVYLLRLQANHYSPGNQCVSEKLMIHRPILETNRHKLYQGLLPPCLVEAHCFRHSPQNDTLSLCILHTYPGVA